MLQYYCLQYLGQIKVYRPEIKTKDTLLLRPKESVPMMNDVSPIIQSARSLILKNLQKKRDVKILKHGSLNT